MHGRARLLNNKGKLVGSSIQTKDNLFYLELGECSCFIAQIEEIWLWHKSLCHVNFDNLIKIRKFKKVRGIPNIKKPKAGLCRNCQIGKMGKTSFKSKNYQSEDILEIVVDPLELKVILEKSYSFFLLRLLKNDDCHVSEEQIRSI